jgi:hypothetical protein
MLPTMLRIEYVYFIEMFYKGKWRLMRGVTLHNRRAARDQLSYLKKNTSMGEDYRIVRYAPDDMSYAWPT